MQRSRFRGRAKIKDLMNRMFNAETSWSQASYRYSDRLSVIEGSNTPPLVAVSHAGRGVRAPRSQSAPASTVHASSTPEEKCYSQTRPALQLQQPRTESITWKLAYDQSLARSSFARKRLEWFKCAGNWKN